MNYPEPQNEEQKNIINGLKRLFAGEPLRENGNIFIWKEIASGALIYIQKKVTDDLESKTGDGRSCTLIIAPYGGGKSNTIYKIENLFNGFQSEKKLALSTINLGEKIITESM